MKYNAADILGLSLGRLVQVEEGMSTLKVEEVDLRGVDLSVEGALGLVVANVLARNMPKAAMEIGEDWASKSDIEV